MTSVLMTATTFRPVAENNTIEIGYEGGVLTKTVTVDAQLTVRNIIQAIAIT